MIEYEVSRSVGACCVTGRALAEGETFYSALFEGPQGFERRDYSEDAWQGPPEGALCVFKTRMPRKAEPAKKTFVDDATLIGFFLGLADGADASRLRFRFVLSLIMLRKRLLKYERTVREGGAEHWEMRLLRDKSLHRVLNPVLTDEQIEELTGRLGAVLAGYEPAEDADGAMNDPNDQASDAADAGDDRP